MRFPELLKYSPVPLAALLAVVIVGGVDRLSDRLPDPHPAICRAIDGDTLRCGAERIRLNGIDSPEMPGHCRPGRQCVVGDPFAARDSLAELAQGNLTIIPLKTDRYGRTVAEVTANGVDLSCAQLERVHAAYKPKWDERKLVWKRCFNG